MRSKNETFDDDDFLKPYEEKCLHESCSECHGTGRKSNGTPCVHGISCPCPKHTFTLGQVCKWEKGRNDHGGREWNGHNATMSFEPNYCPCCGLKVEVV